MRHDAGQSDSIIFSIINTERLHFQNGVGGIFGPTAKTTGHHLMSICDSKDLPYLFSHMSEAVEGYNLHPHPLDIAKALHAVIAGLEWTRFIYLYENSK